MNPTVVVLDGEQRSALAVVRSLGTHGCSVHVGAAGRKSLAGGSRHCRSETRLPDPLLQPADYAEAVAALVRRVGAEALLPVAEPSILALLPHAGALAPCRLPFPDLTRFRRICDKSAVTELARGLGIRCPAQRVAGSRRELAGDDVFPLVLKPSRSVVGEPGRRRKVGVAYAGNPVELAAAADRLGEDAYPLLLQQRVAGYGMGVFLLRWEGRIRASFVHRRLREKPPAGGVSVWCESSAAPDALVQQCARLLEALDWSGVAMIEFKHDPATGNAWLMEINGRFWGSLQLAIDAGVDFPWILLQLLTGRDPGPPPAWRLGVRSRWWWGDVDHLLARLQHSPAELHLPDDAPSRAGVAWSVLRPHGRGDRNEVLRLGDPLPFVRETVGWFRAVLGR